MRESREGFGEMMIFLYTVMMNRIPTSALLSATWRLCRVHIQLFLAGVILFGSVSAGFSLWMEAGSEDILQTVLAPLHQNSDQLSVLTDALQNGSSEDTLNLLMALQGEQMAGLDALSMIGSLMPVLKIALWSALFSFVIACVSSLYFLCCALVQPSTISKVLIRFFLSIPSMIMIVLWSSVRSFAWVPMVGPIIGLILFPRFLFAPVVSIQEKKNAFASVQESYQKTKGSAWYVLSAFTAISTVALFAAVVTIVLLAWTLDPYIGSASVFVRSMIWQMTIGYTVAGLVVMWNDGASEARDLLV